MKFKKNKLTLLIFTIIVISTAIIFYILKPINLFKFILFFKENKECPKCKSRNIVKEHLWSYCLHSWNDLDED